MTLAEIIATFKAARVDRGMSALQVANLIGVSESSLYEWESRKRTPGVEKLLKYAAVVGVTLTASYDVEEPPPVVEPRTPIDADERSELLLAEVLRAAAEIRDEDIGVIHRRLTGMHLADLVGMVVLAAACIPVDESRQDLLQWWTGAGLSIRDLVSTCAWCHDYFVTAPGASRMYCTPLCKVRASRDRNGQVRAA